MNVALERALRIDFGAILGKMLEVSGGAERLAVTLGLAHVTDSLLWMVKE